MSTPSCRTLRRTPPPPLPHRPAPCPTQPTRACAAACTPDLRCRRRLQRHVLLLLLLLGHGRHACVQARLRGLEERMVPCRQRLIPLGLFASGHTRPTHSAPAVVPLSATQPPDSLHPQTPAVPPRHHRASLALPPLSTAPLRPDSRGACVRACLPAGLAHLQLADRGLQVGLTGLAVLQAQLQLQHLQCSGRGRGGTGRRQRAGG